MQDFSHLYLHTTYSLLEGFVKIEEVFLRAKELDYRSLAITDKSNMFGVLKFYVEAKKNGIKAIIGVELKVSVLHQAEKTCLLLYVKNSQGYKNLSKLTSLAYENDEFDPYVKIQQVEEYSEGLMAIVGIRGSALYRYISMDRLGEARERSMLYLAIFGNENVFLALSSGLNREEDSIFSKKVAFSRLSGFKLLALNEIYYTKKEDAVYQDMVYCIKNGELLSNENRKKLPSNKYYMHSKEEMLESFKACPEALYNTKLFTDACDFDFEFGVYHMPEFPFKEQGAKEQLKANCIKGIENRYKNKKDAKDLSKIRERLDYELSVISKMGFEDYFLICEDYVKFAKKQGIQVGPGRGSGGGSLACFLLGITDIDPLEHGLLFERFLNPERLDMPDLDIDFQDDRKGEVLDYVSEKYGRDRVAQIISFGTLSARQVLKDVGRVLGYPSEDMNKISALIPKQKDVLLDSALEEEEKLKQLYLNNKNINTLINCARALEGIPRHSSIHPAGVIISKERMTDIAPTIVKSSLCTQYDMDDVKKLGLVKMDFLSLKKLTIISKILEMLKDRTDFDLEHFENSFDDKKTYRLLSSGNNIGIFQLESAGMMKFFSQLKPVNLADIIIGISIYRPGPASYIPSLLRNRKHPHSISYDHPLLKPVLENTYGCLVYQEQVIEIARSIGGFSYGRADKIRRAMSKKNMEIMEEEKKNFIYGNESLGIQGAIHNGVKEEVAKKIYDRIADFAKYAFNKSHAASYAIIAYRMAYLKANYPREFMLALLNSELYSNDKAKLYTYLREAKEMGIPILPPSVKYSKSLFTFEHSSIRYSLSALKYLGTNTIKEIESLQDSPEGFLDSLQEFFIAMSGEALNKKAIEALCFSGALDSYQINRFSIIDNFDAMHNALSKSAGNVDRSQISLTDLVPMENLVGKFTIRLLPEYDEEVLNKKMLEITGFDKNFFYSEEERKKIYLRLKILNEEEKRYIESIPKSREAYRLFVYEEDFNRLRKFKDKILLNYDILNKLTERYGRDNVKVEKE